MIKHLLLHQIYADGSVAGQSARSADANICVGNAKGMYTSLTQVVKPVIHHRKKGPASEQQCEVTRYVDKVFGPVVVQDFEYQLLCPRTRSYSHLTFYYYEYTRWKGHDGMMVILHPSPFLEFMPLFIFYYSTRFEWSCTTYEVLGE